MKSALDKYGPAGTFDSANLSEIARLMHKNEPRTCMAWIVLSSFCMRFGEFLAVGMSSVSSDPSAWRCKMRSIGAMTTAVPDPNISNS